MLRRILHPHARPRLVAVKIDTTSGTPAVSIGKSDISSLTDGGAGVTTVNLRDPFNRQGFVVATPEIGSGAVANFTTTDIEKFAVITRDNANGAVDGAVHALCLGYDSEYTDRHDYPMHPLTGTRSRARLIPFRLAADGTVEFGSYQVSASYDGGTGVYTVTPKRPFNTAPVLVCGIEDAAARMVNVANVALGSSEITAWDSAAAASTGIIHGCMLGWDTTEDGGLHRKVIETPQRKTRLEAFRVTVAGGVPTIARGTTDATITDGGVGIYTLTFTKPFTSVDVVIPCSYDLGSVANITAKSGTAITIKVWNSAGAALDTAAFHVLVFGRDSADEW